MTNWFANNQPQGLTVFRLPRSHWHCDLRNFHWTQVQPPSLQMHVTKFLDRTEAGEAPHLLLTGDPGCGKTHIGVAVYRAMTTVFGTTLVTWVNVPVFCEAMKRSYGGHSTTPADMWEEYEAARRLVVLDDLFARDYSPHELTQIVYRLIDAPYQNGAAVLTNMNQDYRTLAQSLASHEISRVLAGADVIPIVGQDWRTRK